ncbi:hypothetical protein D9757_010093 [Collybiopsis confluens]|uniref:Uncharacterized protein n=1 Tax=Collybiopsis confluens TaxID=2823264 RepID=A0A8H5GLL5_9AGAR|nr:hypothetical protein D9757_010093 [Collybiopsis confluens]
MHVRVEWEVLADELLAEWKTSNIIRPSRKLQYPYSLHRILSLRQEFCCLSFALQYHFYVEAFVCWRFGSMRKMPKAAMWMQEAHKSDQLIWWNSFIVISMPATWLAWAVLLFLATMTSYTWGNSFQSSSSSRWD